MIAQAVQLLAVLLLAQLDSIDAEIRTLEQREAHAVLQADYATLDAVWSPDFLVNAPSNKVNKGATGELRRGLITYSAFTREIESILRKGEVVIVMGHETVVPRGSTPEAGKTLNRRYTHVWTKEDGKWRLLARHANVIRAP